MKPLVYLAGPYTHPDPVLNTRRAIELGDLLCGAYACAVIIPHLSIVRHLVAPRPVEDWYRLDLDLIEHCDAVVRFPGESVGADRETDHATGLGLPVFRTDQGLAGFDVWRRQWEPAATVATVTTTTETRR